MEVSIPAPMLSTAIVVSAARGELAPHAAYAAMMATPPATATVRNRKERRAAAAHARRANRKRLGAGSR